MEMIDSMRSHRYRAARADKTVARFAFYSNDGNMRDPLLYDPSQQGLPLEQVVMTYLFIEFAARSLETKRSMSFMVI
jgi:hypothetical protein